MRKYKYVTLTIVLVSLFIALVTIPTTLALSPDTDLSNVDASFRGENTSWSGKSVSDAGDVNGDGYDDFLIGADVDDDGGNAAGQTYLILGKASGWAMDTDISNADASFWGEEDSDYSGRSVAGAGDVNGDGYGDFLIGAEENDDGGDAAGQTYLILGKASGWAMDTDLANADASFWGEDAEDYSGRSVSGAGDVNGDGYDDFLIGAYGDDDGGNTAGQTYLILGKPSGWAMDTDLSTADASFWGESFLDRSGFCVSGAGDVNADGYGDFLIGAYQADAGSSAGHTYLILGKASGWTTDTDLSNADASFQGEDGSDRSGYSVSGAGDVNGDGYEDILIGAYSDEDGGALAGQTYLILGKSSGWAMYTNLSNADASFWGEDADDWAGYSVSGARDVNGDGYDDFLVGAWQNDYGGTDAGLNYLILGKASGWAMDTDLSSADASFCGEDSLDYSGHSVSGACDVDGDGYDDFLVGAYGDDDGGNMAGQTYLILSDTTGATNGSYRRFVSSGDTPAIRFYPAGITIDFSACTSSSGYVTVTEHNNQSPGTGYMNRYWSVTPTGLSAYIYDITFKYNDGEIAEAGGDESNLQLHKNDGSGWETVTSTVHESVNEIIATGQTGFSDWAIGPPNIPISYWPFDTGTETVAYDVIGSNDGTINEASWATGISSSALDFDGVNNYVDLPDNDDLRPNHITQAAWVYPGTLGGVNPIIALETLTGGNDGAMLMIHNGYIKFYVGTGIDEVQYLSGTITQINEWYHVVGTYDGVEAELWINGQKVDSEPLTGDISYYTSRDMRIGSWDPANPSYFDGKIDEVRIYNDALSQEEILALYEEELVNIYVTFQGTGRPEPAGWEVPINIGFYPVGSGTATLLNPASATYYFTGTTSMVVTTGTRAYFQCPEPVAPGTYDITVDSSTSLMNVKRNVGIL